jgi:hypothetical protein
MLREIAPALARSVNLVASPQNRHKKSQLPLRPSALLFLRYDQYS